MQQQGSGQGNVQGAVDRDAIMRLLVTAAFLGLAALSIWAGQP